MGTTNLIDYMVSIDRDAALKDLMLKMINAYHERWKDNLHSNSLWQWVKETYAPSNATLENVLTLSNDDMKKQKGPWWELFPDEGELVLSGQHVGRGVHAVGMTKFDKKFIFSISWNTLGSRCRN